MIQDDDDPYFPGLLALPATEAVKEKSYYPSCTIRDVDFRIYGNFFVIFILVQDSSAWRIDVIHEP